MGSTDRRTIPFATLDQLNGRASSRWTVRVRPVDDGNELGVTLGTVEHCMPVPEALALALGILQQAEDMGHVTLLGVMDRLRDFADGHHDEWLSASVDPDAAARAMRVISTAAYMARGEDHGHLAASDGVVAEAKRLLGQVGSGEA